MTRRAAMSDPDILDRIDETLNDYDQWDGHSPDAARWDGDDWVDERVCTAQRIAAWGEERAYVAFYADTSAFVDAMNQLAETVIQVAVEFDAIKRQTEVSTGKSWAYLVQRAERPYSAAERTRSPRWRAGSRRTKRQARRRHG